MGGNALKEFGSKRLPRARALEIGAQVLEKLEGAGFEGRIVPSYGNKETFGDLDLVVKKTDPETLRGLCREWGQGKTSFNKDVLSFGWPLDCGVFQVDLIQVPPAEFSFAYN